MALMNEDVALRFIAALFFGFFYRFNRTKVSMVRNRKESCVDEKKKKYERNDSFMLQSFLLIWISLFCTWPFHGKMRYSSFRKVISHQFSVMMMMMEKKKEFKNQMIIYQVEIIKKWNFSFSPALLFLFFLLFSCNEMEMAGRNNLWKQSWQLRFWISPRDIQWALQRRNKKEPEKCTRRQLISLIVQ